MFTLFEKTDLKVQQTSIEVTQEKTPPTFIPVLGKRERSNSPSFRRNSFSTPETEGVKNANLPQKASSQLNFNAEQYDIVDMGCSRLQFFHKNHPKPEVEAEIKNTSSQQSAPLS